MPESAQNNFYMKSESGQILIEIIIAGLVIIFISLAITQAVQTSVRGVDQTFGKTTAVFLSREMTEAMRAVAKDDWHNITTLATSSANTYFATTSAGAWVSATGTEAVVLNNITYTRYFYLEDVKRSATTNEITTGAGYLDSSTGKIITDVSWTDSTGPNNFSQIVYLSRFLNATFPQQDWSGGPVTISVITSATTTFATSSSIDYGNPNSLKLGSN